MDRRKFLKSILGITGSFSLGKYGFAQSNWFDLSQGTRYLWLYRPATGEQFAEPWLIDGQWVPGAYEKISILLRDVRAEIAVKFDYRLFAVLDWCGTLLRSAGYRTPLYILSGYRTPWTNAMTEGAAKNSLHQQGRAVDVAVPRLSSFDLAKIFANLLRGGIGLYPNKNFVHIDTGAPRVWVN